MKTCKRQNEVIMLFIFLKTRTTNIVMVKMTWPDFQYSQRILSDVTMTIIIKLLFFLVLSNKFIKIKYINKLISRSSRHI